MTVIDVAVQKHLTNAMALVTHRMEALLLGEPKRWICRPNTDDSWITHLYLIEIMRALRRPGFISTQNKTLSVPSQLGPPARKSQLPAFFLSISTTASNVRPRRHRDCHARLYDPGAIYQT